MPALSDDGEEWESKKEEAVARGVPKLIDARAERNDVCCSANTEGMDRKPVRDGGSAKMLFIPFESRAVLGDRGVDLDISW